MTKAERELLMAVAQANALTSPEVKALLTKMSEPEPEPEPEPAAHTRHTSRHK